jgi:hypothetical protein
MVFSDYKHISQVQQQFQIKYREERFVRAQPIEPSAGFLSEFNFNKENLDILRIGSFPGGTGHSADLA